MVENRIETRLSSRGTPTREDFEEGIIVIAEKGQSNGGKCNI